MVYDVSPDSSTCEDFAANAEWLLQGGLTAQTVRNHFGAKKALYSWSSHEEAIDILSSAQWQLSIKGIVNTVRPSFNILAAMIPDDLVAMVEGYTLYFWCTFNIYFWHLYYCQFIICIV